MLDSLTPAQPDGICSAPGNSGTSGCRPASPQRAVTTMSSRPLVPAEGAIAASAQPLRTRKRVESGNLSILMVSHLPPWPPNRGAEQRVFNIAKALSELGSTDLLTLAPEGYRGRGDLEVLAGDSPSGLRFGAISCVEEPRRKRPWFVDRPRWLLQESLPASLFGRDYDAVRRASLEAGRRHYDLIWFSRP